MRRPIAIGAVLAGGLSRRMGEPKALTELAGRSLIERVVATIEIARLEPVVVAKPDSPLPPIDCRVLAEPSEPRHPLCGIVTALRASGGRPVVAVACDTPFVPAKLLAWLAELDDEVAVPEIGGRLEPLVARYTPAAADRLEAVLGDGVPLRDAVAGLGPRIVSEAELGRFGDPQRIAFNVNSPGDLDRALELLAHR
jgi:molybdopterin-guanine dinucleotide biosynthesis protein A